jgi:cyclopropane fatty-acyl-phospholipid synthase-like methyltransferase
MTASMNVTAFWNISPCSFVEVDKRFRGAALMMMDAVQTSKTWVYFETTRCYMPEGGHTLQQTLIMEESSSSGKQKKTNSWICTCL